MKINEVSIDGNLCKGNSCPCHPGYKCWEISPNIFESPQTSPTSIAQVKLNPIPLEMQSEAEWAIFRCWEQGPGAILGRGEPDLPEPI